MVRTKKHLHKLMKGTRMTMVVFGLHEKCIHSAHLSTASRPKLARSAQIPALLQLKRRGHFLKKFHVGMQYLLFTDPISHPTEQKINVYRLGLERAIFVRDAWMQQSWVFDDADHDPGNNFCEIIDRLIRNRSINHRFCHLLSDRAENRRQGFSKTLITNMVNLIRVVDQLIDIDWKIIEIVS